MANYHCNYISESSPFQAIGAYTREACISLLLDQYSVIIRHLFCFFLFLSVNLFFIHSEDRVTGLAAGQVIVYSIVILDMGK